MNEAPIRITPGKLDFTRCGVCEQSVVSWTAEPVEQQPVWNGDVPYLAVTLVAYVMDPCGHSYMRRLSLEDADV